MEFVLIPLATTCAAEIKFTNVEAVLIVFWTASVESAMDCAWNPPVATVNVLTTT
jgi:hypothetical protein